MRLFIAIDVPELIKEHLSFLQRSLDFQGLRPVSPKNIHLTLNFLGDQVSPDIIIAKLKSISFTPFILRLATINYFPHITHPRVMWIGLEESTDLAHLQRAIDVLFTPKNSFKPHLTLARFKKITDSNITHIVHMANKLDVKQLSFKVSSFKLYTSTLTPLGPVYEVLEVFKANN